MKVLKITLAIFLILGLGLLMLYIFTNNFEKKIKILNCEGVYYSKIFSEPDFYYLNNAKADVAMCLCEKYISTKDNAYKNEVLKCYSDSTYTLFKIRQSIINVDSICKNRKDIFIKVYDM